MIIKVNSIDDCKICDNFLTLLIQDEKKYDTTIDKNFVVQNYYTGTTTPESTTGSDGDLYFKVTR